MAYRSFFSYARADDKVADWLHRQLDGYRTPKELVGRDGPLGPVPAKFHPIFRDRTDLQAGGHVKDSLQLALENSQTLIVLCTPSSARSAWVDHECETFLRLGREGRIFPVIADGEPDSGDASTECFPSTLRGRGLLAADLREILLPTGQIVGDGREGGRLKLIAGLLGVPLDTLIRRERRRQRRTIVALSASALVFAVVAASAIAFWTIANQRANTILAQSEEIVQERDRAVATAEQVVRQEKRAERLIPLALTQMGIGVADDTEHPDYRHLTTHPRYTITESEFTLTPAVLDQLILSNAVSIGDAQRIVFVLRGLDVSYKQFLQVGDNLVDMTSVIVEDKRPNHLEPRSLVVVYEVPRRAFTILRALSEPAHERLHRQISEASAQATYGSAPARANLLPTGFYRYVVGTHQKAHPRAYRPASLRQAQLIPVRRTHDDTSYTTKDDWDFSRVVFDNFHSVARFEDVVIDVGTFSGTIVMEGVFDRQRGTYSGEYARFTQALGIEPLEMRDQRWQSVHDGKEFLVLVSTGAEAMMTSRSATSEELDGLKRLRFGSSGELVAKLQEQLGVDEDAYFGVTTTQALAHRQTSMLGWSDGIFSPEMEELLGIDIGFR